MPDFLAHAAILSPSLLYEDSLLGLRLFAAAGAVVAGLSLAVAPIPVVGRLEDSASAHIGLRDS